MKYMHRRLEETVNDWLDGNDMRPLLIQGARRTGKTTLVEDVGIKRFGNNFVKLDFQTNAARTDEIFSGATDDIERITKKVSELLRRDIDRESTLLFFDEVQLNEKALNSLRFFSGSGWRVIATGSLFGVTLRQRKLPFPSGIRQVNLHPMDFEEWLEAAGEIHMARAIRDHVASGDAYVLHNEALEQYHQFLTVGGMPQAVRTWMESHDHELVRSEHEEIALIYTADMTDPENGISGAAAKRIWDSLPKQLMRSSTKKFKYADVMRGGRRTQLLEPLEWLEAAGIVTINDLTCDTQAPLTAYCDEEGSYFKVYVADTGLMFHKFNVDAELFLDPMLKGVLSSDFRGALAENAVAQAFAAHDIQTFYWMPDPNVGRGEVDFIFQNRRAEVIPVEVKSGRNVRARSLAMLVTEGRSPYAYLLSELNFSRSTVKGTDCEQRGIPLYAAFALDGAIQ